MRKLIVLLGTLCAFIFAFTMSIGVHAEELPTEQIEEVVEEEKGVLTDEELEEIYNKVAEYTSSDIADLTMALYTSLGIVGLVIMLFIIMATYLLVKKAKNDALTNDIVSGVAADLTKINEASNEEIEARINDLRDLVKQLIVKNNNDRKAEYIKAQEELDQLVDEVLDTVVSE